MTAATLTIADFLLARITEDEAKAREVLASQRHDVARAPGDWPRDFDPLKDFYLGGADGPIGYTVLMAGVGRVLAECEAKRRIVDVARYADEGSAGWGFRRILGDLAAVYADHPDYNPDWRP